MMLRAKKAAKGKQVVSNIERARKIPFDAFKTFMMECIIKFYKLETTLSLDNKYVRYQEECPRKFKVYMRQKM